MYSLTTRAWCALRDLTAKDITRPATRAAWRAACPFLPRPQRWYDARSRLLARGHIEQRGHQVWLGTAPRELAPRPVHVAAPRVARALSAAQPAPGACPVCTRGTVRWHRHAALGHVCPSCATAAHMLRDAGTAQRLADLLAVLG